MQRIGLILLAAGSSSRLGQPKQLLPYQQRTLLRQAAEVAATSGCAPLVLVTGALHDELLPEVAGLPFYVVRNEDWAQGMSTSIQAGLDVLEMQTKAAPLDAAIVMLCDQPLLTPGILRQLVTQFQATGQPLVACEYGGTRGVPALFGQTLFLALHALQGPAGARELLRQYADLPAVDFPGGAVDVDTVAQYQQLLAQP
ncbi:nucleotidyltransferase family protein [Hymenobacter sp. ASUV-10]|uniref:Nucleotidyltransferase family protein n=1 Tax=Hymenobacter aranciens TaxID=3063996 RepID=A0ABT9BMN9_9BACT|nr:nucleotidyltransferase family protein [Hymenobacter sp. ASUV-10]MDO7877783.1 nucleotidyltransferase family protein [Hymenobacter sp. ASUV-10]